ncbi:MAG: ATP-binding protein [Desulfotomaculum sp.]|nr:ATP-binding protein [Desulfotomaculum sp.]
MKIDNLLPKLIRAALSNDVRAVQSISLTLCRKLKKENPKISEEIAKALSYVGVGANPLRSIGFENLPLDSDSGQTLLKFEEPIEIDPPIYQENVQSLMQRFILERRNVEKLITNGIKPPTSMLLIGPPGVGKTYLAKYLSFILDLGLIVLDLSTAISSYLGKTGQNLRSVLDFARSQPSILFLDEFDAIAKRRDEPGDLGELKRIVNVLLKELEDWPVYSIIIAATNHPELLDKAIWRRFDYVVEINLPSKEGSIMILQRYLNVEIDHRVLSSIAELISGVSPAEIKLIADRVNRRFVLEDIDPLKCLLEEISQYINDDSKKAALLARLLRKSFGKSITIRQIAALVNKSPSTVHHYLKEVKDE